MANRKLCKRILGITLQGKYVKLDRESKLYVDRNRYYLVDKDGKEQKYLKRLISELHKGNPFNSQVQVISV